MLRFKLGMGCKLSGSHNSLFQVDSFVKNEYRSLSIYFVFKELHHFFSLLRVASPESSQISSNLAVEIWTVCNYNIPDPGLSKAIFNPYNGHQQLVNFEYCSFPYICCRQK